MTEETKIDRQSGYEAVATELGRPTYIQPNLASLETALRAEKLVAGATR